MLNQIQQKEQDIKEIRASNQEITKQLSEIRKEEFKELKEAIQENNAQLTNSLLKQLQGELVIENISLIDNFQTNKEAEIDSLNSQITEL